MGTCFCSLHTDTALNWDGTCWLCEKEEKKTAETDLERFRAALVEISCPSQTTDLLWWQERARAALNTPDRET